MEEKKEDKEILVVKDEQTGEVSAVTGLKKNGTPKRMTAKRENAQDFLRFDKHGDMLDNFFTNFFRQCKEPKRFGFYLIAENGMENVMEVMKNLLKDPKVNKEMLTSSRVDTSKYEKQAKEKQEQKTITNNPNPEDMKKDDLKGEKNTNEGTPAEQSDTTKSQGHETKGEIGQVPKSYQPIDESHINWQEMEEKWGVSRQMLEESGSLDKMLNFGKSFVLLPISPKFGDITLHTDARLSFKQGKDGSISLVPYAIRKEPQLDKEFYGYTFTKEDKETLLKSGNMGRTAEITNRSTGEVIPMLISIDRLTNDIVAVPISKVYIPKSIGGTEITEKDKKTLFEGGQVHLKSIQRSNGKGTFSAIIQVNADKRGIEFVPENQKQLQGKWQQGFQYVDAEGKLHAPKTFGKVELTLLQREQFSAGKAIYVQGMIHDGKGEPFNAYIRFEPSLGIPKHYTENPALLKMSQVIPKDESKTQVAINSEGKTNEATKNLKEPLKQGQVSPNNERQKEQQQDKGLKKSGGIHI